MSLIRRPAALLALTVVLILGLLALGLWLGGHPEDLPGFMRSAFVADEKTKVLDEAISTVTKDYYRPIKTQSLVSSSISGMVSSLHDPYSVYLPPSSFKSFDQPETFTGIGVSVQPDKQGLRVLSVFNGSPARRSGLKSGEVIIEADGHSLAGVSLEKAVSLIEGPPGTQVQLEGSRGGHPRTA